MEILTFILWLVCIWACYDMAQQQGKNKIIAILLGALFGVFAVIGYYIVGKRNV